MCGITPYDATHLGHAATYVAYDTLLRVWRDGKAEPVYVQNVTDIDDPLLERAAATGVSWTELAQSQTDLFRSDMTALSVLPPDNYVGVVESMEQIIAGVNEMVAAGAAYWVDSDVYADLSVDPNFGSIGHYDAATQLEYFTERGGDPDRVGKRDPLDPLLWLGQRPGEPAWDGGNLGMGRPGWHIECSIIAREFLDVPFAVQGGGVDLIFPHHEMSTSHLRVLTGMDEPVAVTMHAALIAYQGEKMSKSLGNLVFVSSLLADGVDPSAIRLLLLGEHYRDEWEYTDDLLTAAQTRLQSWRDALARSTDDRPDAVETLAGADVLERVRAALAADLDTPAALEIVDAWAQAGGSTPADAALVADTVDALLGIKLR